MYRKKTTVKTAIMIRFPTRAPFYKSSTFKVTLLTSNPIPLSVLILVSARSNHPLFFLNRRKVLAVGRALHLHCRGHGFESCSSLKFFQAFFSQLLKLHKQLRGPFFYLIFHLQFQYSILSQFFIAYSNTHP